MKLIETISNDLNVPVEMLQEATAFSRKLVKHIKIPKRDGTYRLVYQPSKKLKIIQYWLDYNIYRNLAVHDCATAYQNNKSVKFNAVKHQQGRYFLKLDLKDFFPSIKFVDFSPYIQSWNTSEGFPYDEDDLLELIRYSCFYIGDSLPIGYPTSPIISNIVMYSFDSKIISKLTDKGKYGAAVYTRYADDMTFSTNLKGACNKLRTLVRNELKSMRSPKLAMNASKTRFVSSSGGSAFITGLRVCHDGHITIHRRYKDKVRLLVSLYEKDRLSQEDIRSLRGHLCYIRHVDSPFYTKLQNRHFASLNMILSETY